MTSPQSDTNEEVIHFRPKGANVFAGFALSLLLAVAGSFLAWITAQRIYDNRFKMPFVADQGDSWLILGGIFMAGIGMVVGAVLLFRYALRLMRLKIEFRQSGFRHKVGAVIVDVPWNAVLSVKETITYEKLPIVKGPARALVPTVASKSYEVTCLPKQVFHFDGNSVDNLPRFAELLRERTSAVKVPWRIVEVRTK